MGRRLFIALVVGVLSAGAAALGAPGGVHGRVLDPGGEALPGVVVTLTIAGASPATLTAVTDQAGRFDLACGPGRYRLRAELQGFQPATRDIVVGQDALSLDLSLAIAGYAEQVTVKAPPPPAVLGPPEPDAPSTVTREVVDAGMLPNSQYDDVLPLLPNVVRGPDGQISVAGARPHESALFVNGFDETDPIVAEPRLMLPLEAVDTMDVFAGGYAAELGPATGGVTSVRTRSGSDVARMTVTSFMPRIRFSDGTARVESWEPNLGLSGPIARGRAFIEEALSYRFDVERFDTLVGEQQNAFNGVLSWTQLDLQATPDQRLTAAVSFDPQRVDHANITAFTPGQSVPALAQGGWSLNLADHVVAGKELVADVRLSTVRSRLDVTPDGSLPYALGHDLARGSYFDNQQSRGQRVEAGAELTFTGWAHHVLKAGATIARASVDATDAAAPAVMLRSDGSISRIVSFVAGQPLLRASEGEQAAFAQDAWTPWSGLTIDAGIRYDRAGSLRGARALPRAGWRLALGDGRSTISGSAGLFADRVPLRAQLFPGLPSRMMQTFDEAGQPMSAQLLTNAIAGPLWMPLAARWDVELDRQWSSAWLTRVRYQERRGRDEPIVTPQLLSATDGLLLLESTGRSQARSIEATVAYRPSSSGDQLFVSYVRSRARGDLNGLDLIEGAFRRPYVEADATGPLPADVPNRLLAWGLLRLPARIEVAPFAEIRDGFPFSPIGEDWSRVGPANGRRFPWFGSLDLYVNRVFGLPLHLPDARIGLKTYNLASGHTERDIQSDIVRADFGRTYNPIPRDYTVVLELLWGK